MPVELLVGRRPAAAAPLRHRRHSVAELDRHRGRLLIDPIDDEAGQILVAGMAVEKEEAAEAVMDQALRGLEVHALERLRRERHRPGKFHVVRRLPDHQHRRDKDVGALRDQLRLFHSGVEVGPHRRLRSVLFD